MSMLSCRNGPAYSPSLPLSQEGWSLEWRMQAGWLAGPRGWRARSSWTLLM